MPKICQKCGFQAADNMNFCPSCHEKLVGSDINQELLAANIQTPPSNRFKSQLFIVTIEGKPISSKTSPTVQDILTTLDQVKDEGHGCLLNIQTLNKLEWLKTCALLAVNRNPLETSGVASIAWNYNSLMLIIADKKFIAQYSSFDDVKRAFCAFLKNDGSHKHMFRWQRVQR